MNEKPVSPARDRSPSGLWWVLIAIVLVAIALVWMPRRTAGPVGRAPVAQAPATPPAAAGPQVTVARAAQLQAEGAFLVDVRQPEEWAEGHIEGSKLIPLDDLESRLAEVPRDRSVVVVCHSGNRSKHGRDILLRAGYAQAVSMTGGLSAWEADGQKTVKGM
ncbi:MAG TPA: rhodanese-like domain-containing protein [Candidatus Binatia bacterium]|nr:rhodanese-like domain-containing protein [Candidatus Binatia bacterium]